MKTSLLFRCLHSLKQSIVVPIKTTAQNTPKAQYNDASSDDDEPPIGSLPTLQRRDANRPPSVALRTTLLFPRRDRVLTQYKSHAYLTHHKLVANTYIETASQAADVLIPGDIANLCISYSYAYDDGLYQLANSLSTTLSKWNQKSISKQFIYTLIAAFFTRTPSDEQVGVYFVDLVHSQHLLVFDIIGDGSFIGVRGKERRSAVRYCRLTE